MTDDPLEHPDPFDTIREAEWGTPYPSAVREALLILRDRLEKLDQLLVQVAERSTEGFRVVADIGERVQGLAATPEQEGGPHGLADRLARLEKASEDRYDALEQMVELRTDLPGRDVHLHLPAHDAGCSLLWMEALGYHPPSDDEPTDDPRPAPSIADEHRKKDQAVLRIWRRGLEAIANGQADPPAVARAVLAGEDWDSVPTTNIRDLTETHATRRLREATRILDEAARSVRNENRSGASRGIEKAQRMLRQVRDAMLREQPATKPGPTAPVAQDPGWHFPSGYGDEDGVLPWLTEEGLERIRDSVTEFSGGGDSRSFEHEQLANLRVAIEEEVGNHSPTEREESGDLFDPDERDGSTGRLADAKQTVSIDRIAINHARAGSPPADVKAVREMVDGIRQALDPEGTNAALTAHLHRTVESWYRDQPTETPSGDPTVTVPLGLAHAAAWMVEIPESTADELQRRIVAFRGAVTQGLQDAFGHDATSTFMHPLNTPWTPDTPIDDTVPTDDSAPSREREGSGNAASDSNPGPLGAAEGPEAPVAPDQARPYRLTRVEPQIDRMEPGVSYGFEPLSVRQARRTIEAWQPGEDPTVPDDVVRAHDVVRRWAESHGPVAISAPHPDEVDPLPPTGGPEGPGAPPEPGDATYLPPPRPGGFLGREQLAGALWRVIVRLNQDDGAALPFHALPEDGKEVWRQVADEAERHLSSPDSARAREALSVLADALRKIGSQDYRGNLPADVTAARDAVAAAQNAYGGVLPGNQTSWEAPF